MGDYSIRVIQGAWRETSQFFRLRLRAALAFIASVAIGFGLFWWFMGIKAVIDQAYVLAAFTSAPVIVFAVFLFLWNVFLAPSRAIYEKLDQLEIIKVSQDKQQKLRPFDFEPPNYGTWREVSHATIYEIARICANEEPNANPDSGRGRPYEKIIIAGVEAGKIR